MGRYRRFRETKLFGRYYMRFFRNQNIIQSKKKLLRTRLTDEQMYPKYGIHVYEPFTSLNEKKIRQVGTLKLMDDEKMFRKEESFWKPEIPQVKSPFRSCLFFNGTIPLAEGLNHASAIAKCVPKEGLPEFIMNGVEKVEIENLNEKLNRLIMQSQAWDSALEILPKRRDPVLWWRNWPRYYGIPQLRKNSILLDNLFRLTLTLTKKFPLLNDLRYFKSGEINAFTERSEDLLRIYFSPYMTICSEKPLKEIENKTVVNRTVDEKVPDIYPIEKKLDLAVDNLDEGANKEENIFPLMWADRQLTPHTLFINKENNLAYPWTTKELLGNALMSAFGAAVSIAKRKYGEIQKVLPEPVVTQVVQINGGEFNFVVFQLNTLDLNNDDGIKNMAWFDGGNKFFSTPNFWENFERVNDLNLDVYKKFLALTLNSAA